MDLPAGIKAVTGTLVANPNAGSIANGATGGVRISIDVGPGFVAGLTDILVEMNTFAAAGSNTFRLGLNNPEQSLTTMMSASQAFWQAGRAAITSATEGNFDSKTPYHWHLPVFTVRDIVGQWSNSTGGSISPSLWVYYQIYEVKDAEFMRIAGLSLSRQ